MLDPEVDAISNSKDSIAQIIAQLPVDGKSKRSSNEYSEGKPLASDLAIFGDTVIWLRGNQPAEIRELGGYLARAQFDTKVSVSLTEYENWPFKNYKLIFQMFQKENEKDWHLQAIHARVGTRYFLIQPNVSIGEAISERDTLAFLQAFNFAPESAMSVPGFISEGLVPGFRAGVDPASEVYVAQ